MHRFEYFKPKTLHEAVTLLSGFDGKADVLAGGTDLLVEMKGRARVPDFVVDIKRIPDLDRLNCNATNGPRFGALVTARQLETSSFVHDNYRGLWVAARQIGSIQIRNRATVAGNICRASPSADMLPPLIAADAVIHIFGPQGERTALLEDFFAGPGKSRLGPHELLTEIVVPAPAPHSGSAYIKLGRRKAMELATVGVGVSLTREGNKCRDVRIVLGAVAATPIRARKAETLLRGERLDERTIEIASATAATESRPISNVRGSADYRRDMVRVLTKRAIVEAMEQGQ